MDQKKCLECGTAIKGRRDKKFCDDLCRNAHYNKQHCDAVLLIRNIHNILRKNRRILEALLPEHQQKSKVLLQKLVDAGFSLRYHTHIELNRLGSPRYYCYEYGYQKVGEDVVIFKKEEKLAA
jgi:predicted nucleic acid-binding Zn ribbon protein